MTRRGSRPASGQRGFDPQDAEAMQAAVAQVAQAVSSLTVHMCWHGGKGHDYPSDAMKAAERLRERHAPASDDAYTSMTFTPRGNDVSDFLLVAAFCDLAYATDASGHTILEVTDEGSVGTVRDRR